MQQHSQHFNLSGEVKQQLEQLTARRYPGKKRKQSQLIEDLITQEFAKEYAMSTATTARQEPEPNWLAPFTQDALGLAQQAALRLKATAVAPEHLLLGLVEQSEKGVLSVLATLRIDVSTMRSHLDRLLTSEHQDYPVEEPSGVQQVEVQHHREELFNELKPGEVRRGIISRLAQFGAFVDLGGAHGLVHISQLTWSPINHPSEVVHVGQEVAVQILSVDKEKKKIALSIKGAEVDPWTTIRGAVTPDVKPFHDNLPLSSEAQASLHRALLIAKRMHSPLVQPEHLFLSILQNQRIQDFLALLLPFPEALRATLAGASQGMSSQETTCPLCKRLIQAHWKHCVYCGQLLASVCSQCGASRAEVEGVRFCYECGSPLE